MREIEDQLSKGIYIPEKKIPLFSDVAKDWLEYKKLNLRESTWSVYEGHIRNHFKEFDEIKINRITTAKVERFITNRREGLKIACLRLLVTKWSQATKK